MTTFHLVPPELVKRVNGLLARVKRERATQDAVQSWTASVDGAKVIKPRVVLHHVSVRTAPELTTTSDNDRPSI